MLADGSAVALGDSSNGVVVGVVAKGRDLVVLGPRIEHRHAHAVVVGDDEVNLLAKGRRPGADSVASRCCIPGGTRRVLHLLRGKLANGVGLATNLHRGVLDKRGRAIRVGTNGIGDNLAVLLDAGAKGAAHAAGAGDGVVVAHVANGKDVANDAVAIAVKRGNVLLDVVLDHLALSLGALVGVKANVVGLVVEVEGGGVKLAGGAVGRLAVEPHQRLVLVGNCAGSRGSGGVAARAVGAAATAGEHTHAGKAQGAKATDLKEPTTRHFHGFLPFPVVRAPLRKPLM